MPIRPYQTTIQKIETRSFDLSFVERNESGELERHSFTVELPVIGRLQQQEREFIELDVESRPDAFGHTSYLAGAISQAEELDIYEVYWLLTGDSQCKLSPEQQLKIKIKYVEEISATASKVKALTHLRKRAEATALLIGRGGLSDWTLEKTANLPDEQFDAIYAFAAAEVLGEPQPAKETDTEQLTEALKKPRKKRASRSDASPTGTGSSGSSSNSGPTTPDSAPKTSRRSRSTSSTKRLPKDSSSEEPISTH